MKPTRGDGRYTDHRSNAVVSAEFTCGGGKQQRLAPRWRRRAEAPLAWLRARGDAVCDPRAGSGLAHGVARDLLAAQRATEARAAGEEREREREREIYMYIYIAHRVARDLLAAQRAAETRAASEFGFTR